MSFLFASIPKTLQGAKILFWTLLPKEAQRRHSRNTVFNRCKFHKFHTKGTWGIHLPSSSLSPSWPALFMPQPKTAPERERAKLWAPPAATCANGIPSRDLTLCGLAWDGNSFPRPSCPWLFFPHVKNWPSEIKRWRVIQNGFNSTSLSKQTEALLLPTILTPYKLPIHPGLFAAVIGPYYPSKVITIYAKKN